MPVAIKNVLYRSRAAVLAAVLAFAALPAHADGFGAQSPLDGPAGSLLSGVQACEPTLEAGLSEGSGCMAGWAVNHLLLDAATRFANTQGQAFFGEHFRIVNTMSFSSTDGTVSGGLDVVLPLASSTLSGAGPSETGAFFLQQGVTRWVDSHGLDRNDLRLGLVRRFDLSDEDAALGILGVSTFVQQSREFLHTRVVAGTDYAGNWGRGSLNLFIPTTGWKAAQAGYEERALAGIELGLKLDLTTTLSVSTAVGQWEEGRWPRRLDDQRTDGRGMAAASLARLSAWRGAGSALSVMTRSFASASRCPWVGPTDRRDGRAWALPQVVRGRLHSTPGPRLKISGSSRWHDAPSKAINSCPGRRSGFCRTARTLVTRSTLKSLLLPQRLAIWIWL